MRTVTIHVAKTQFSRLIEAALAGEEVVIAKGDKPVVRLVAIPQGRFISAFSQRALWETGLIFSRRWTKTNSPPGRVAADDPLA